MTTGQRIGAHSFSDQDQLIWAWRSFWLWCNSIGKRSFDRDIRRNEGISAMKSLILAIAASMLLAGCDVPAPAAPAGATVVVPSTPVPNVTLAPTTAVAAPTATLAAPTIAPATAALTATPATAAPATAAPIAAPATPAPTAAPATPALGTPHTIARPSRRRLLLRQHQRPQRRQAWLQLILSALSTNRIQLLSASAQRSYGPTATQPCIPQPPRMHPHESGLPTLGAIFRFTFPQPAEFSSICTRHPAMAGIMQVTP